FPISRSRNRSPRRNNRLQWTRSTSAPALEPELPRAPTREGQPDTSARIGFRLLTQLTCIGWLYSWHFVTCSGTLHRRWHGVSRLDQQVNRAKTEKQFCFRKKRALARPCCGSPPEAAGTTTLLNDIEVLDALGKVLVLRFLAVQLDVEAHLVGRVGEAQRVLEADAALLVEVEKRLVE